MFTGLRQKCSLYDTFCCECHARVPLDISAFSVRPPHRERVTSGRSLVESERHSVPLSAAALPTDCGDCEPECISESIQCLAAASVSLEKKKEKEKKMVTICHDTGLSGCQ